MFNISVCMATYNGAKYIKEQLDSILMQMQGGDEIVLVDDASGDATLDIVRGYKDARIRVCRNEINVGHVQSFSKALGMAKNPYMVLADQDDVWVAGRLEIIRSSLHASSALLITGNSSFINAEGEVIGDVYPRLRVVESRQYCVNIFRIFLGRGYYYGCNMAIKKEFLRLVLPFPAYVESHDLWVAIAANLFRCNQHLDDVLLNRRIHESNVTNSRRPFYAKIKSRFIFLLSIIHLLVRRVRV